MHAEIRANELVSDSSYDPTEPAIMMNKIRDIALSGNSAGITDMNDIFPSI
jgi:hypothetical protein